MIKFLIGLVGGFILGALISPLVPGIANSVLNTMGISWLP